jgi:hypothetical protein
MRRRKRDHHSRLPSTPEVRTAAGQLFTECDTLRQWPQLRIEQLEHSVAASAHYLATGDDKRSRWTFMRLHLPL